MRLNLVTIPLVAISHTAMKRLVLGKDWTTKRMKAMRFRLIGLLGQVIRLSTGCEAAGTIIAARQAIRALVHRPAGSSDALATASGSWLSGRTPPFRAAALPRDQTAGRRLASVAQHPARLALRAITPNTKPLDCKTTAITARSPVL
jgi:hypothetical protein